MKLNLSAKDMRQLEGIGIQIDPEKEYTTDELLTILEAIHEQETFWAQTADEKSSAQDNAEKYAALADLIQKQIPEE